MQPGYPGSGQEPYGTQPPYRDPYAQPHYPSAQDERRGAQDVPPSGHDEQADPVTPAAVPQQRSVATPPPPAARTAAGTVGLIGMVLGVLSVPTAFCTVLGIPIAIVFGATGVVLGVLGLRRIRAGEAGNRGQAIAAVIGGSVGLLAAIAGAAALAYNGTT
jgi:hypothetical protein